MRSTAPCGTEVRRARRKRSIGSARAASLTIDGQGSPRRRAGALGASSASRGAFTNDPRPTVELKKPAASSSA